MVWAAEPRWRGVGAASRSNVSVPTAACWTNGESRSAVSLGRPGYCRRRCRLIFPPVTRDQRCLIDAEVLRLRAPLSKPNGSLPITDGPAALFDSAAWPQARANRHRGRDDRGLKTGKEIKMINVNNTAKARPTHRIYAVTGKGETKFWQPIGAMWPHTDGQGFSQRLDYLPLNGAEIVIRAIVEGDAKDDQTEAQE
jgi:hypothetical protein